MYALEVHNLSKTYRFYPKPFDRLKEAIFRKPCHQPIHSLQQISFSVPFGSTVGIIGDNGAGKSTLLKIIAGTLTPTQGEIVKRGKVAALLELGAGFHPDFTGRQNILLNASLMGLTQAEIQSKEADIIEFAELGPFIDRPMRMYSSGMLVRLAFSIATSIDPDILIVDEALSVGDQYFAKKCIDRMMSFRNSGKTILLCSHGMFLINLLCQHAIWIDHGSIRQQGPATSITAAYENYSREKSAASDNPSESDSSTHIQPETPIRITDITLNGTHEALHLPCHSDLLATIRYESLDDRPFWVAIGIRRNDDLVCHAVSLSRNRSTPLSGKGSGCISVKYSSLPLLHGEYSVIGFILDESEAHCYAKQVSATFSIIPPEKWNAEMGVLDLPHEWICP